MPDALSLLNINDACHLKHLVWVVYDGTLLVGRQPELPGDHQWCTVLADTFKHIYRGHNDVAHCPPYTLALWDCQERTEVLCQGGKTGRCTEWPQECIQGQEKIQEQLQASLQDAAS